MRGREEELQLYIIGDKIDKLRIKNIYQHINTVPYLALNATSVCVGDRHRELPREYLC